MTAKIFCAIDTPDLSSAKTLAQKLAGLPVGIKLGLEFFTAQGPEGVQIMREACGVHNDFFLDLKLHDIPNTVAGAVRAAMRCRPQFLTLHASGGVEMMKAALAASLEEEKKSGIKAPALLAVTVLTHMDEKDLSASGQMTPVADQVLRLATLAKEEGLPGVVCSPHEIRILRERLGNDFLLIVPGIRPAGSAKADQKRVMTPAEALQAGASSLVIGRPITQAPDPAIAAREILASLLQPPLPLCGRGAG